MEKEKKVLWEWRGIRQFVLEQLKVPALRVVNVFDGMLDIRGKADDMVEWPIEQRNQITPYRCSFILFFSPTKSTDTRDLSLGRHSKIRIKRMTLSEGLPD